MIQASGEELIAIWNLDLLASSSLHPRGCNIQGFFSKVFETSYIYIFHACGLWMKSFVTVRAFLPFSSIFPFGCEGISEEFFVSFLLLMCMSFLFIFIFRFPIFVVAIMRSECMRPWAFDCAHVDELGFLLCQGFDKVLKRCNNPG
jgi:hypothetical protein